MNIILSFIMVMTMVKLSPKLHLPFEPWPVANLVKFNVSIYYDCDEDDKENGDDDLLDYDDDND